MKVYNEIEKIYEGKEVIEKDGRFHCPVCKKSYAKRERTQKHLNEWSCHSYKQVFEGTQSEELFYELYKAAKTSNRIMRKLQDVPVSPKEFKKHTKSYNLIAKFYTFCLGNNIKDPIDYFTYVVVDGHWKDAFVVFHIAQVQFWLNSYFKHRRENVNEKTSELFWNQYQDELKTNTQFLIRALERGEIRWDYLFERIKIQDLFLTDAEKEQIVGVLNEFV
jgi:ribosomal protein L37AE/L43A